MIKVGLDFGTTNSTLSYFHSDKIECYRMSASHLAYIPSYVRYSVSDSSVAIGRIARRSQGDEDYQVFSGFKMLLAEKNQKTLDRYGYTSRTPGECTKSYIEHLIRSYCDNHHISQGLESIVITVPDIWTKEHRHAARE